jgi:iron complex transport system permease protein
MSLNWYLISRASLPDALVADRWLLGSLNGADWTAVRALVVALAVLVPLLALLSRPLAAMEAGDDTSLAQGVRVHRLRPAVALVGVALAAVATAAAGPVAFVAFMAPQITRRLTRAAGPNVTVGALGGAVLLVGADLVAQRLPTTVPVGIVTGLIGGAYLVWLLTRRRTS